MTTLALPDILGRKDFDSGAWSVDETAMSPGQAWTFITERKMQIPGGDTELERSVRAHEMMHAKVSPAGSTKEWLDRGKVTLRALKSAEEIRVNELCKRVGFDMKRVFDGTEKPGGEFVAKNDRWEQAVYDVAACAGTGRLTEYLKGVRKHNPEWAKTLKVFADRLVKQISKVPDAALASTEVHRISGLSPAGYAFTEGLAILIDSVAKPAAPPEDDPHEDEPGVSTPDAGDEKDAKPKPAPISTEQAGKITMPDEPGSAWDNLRIMRYPMPKSAPGGIGKKRRASQIGRVPRHINRMLTDPDRKVFDTVRKGKGGVVLIDGSASMEFSQDDIKRITQAAPGALVAIYCSNKRTGDTPNLMIIADKGRMVEELPERVAGNGVDGPAARWAVEQRQTSRSPIVWVTDGLAHGPSQRYTDSAGVECAEIAYKNGIIVRPNVEQAIKVLENLKRGRKPGRWFPSYWIKSWREVYGRTLPSVRI